jgi:serine protease DegS
MITSLLWPTELQYMRKSDALFYFLVAIAALPVSASAPAASLSGVVSYAEAVERAAPAVVSVIASGRESGRTAVPQQNDLRGHSPDGAPPWSRRSAAGPLLQRGSGVILDRRGYIVTSSHVVRHARQIEVVLHDGERLPAAIAGIDADADIALLQLDLGQRRATAEPLAEITPGAASGLRVGDVVLAIGNPYGVGQTVTMGIVSATGRNHLGMSRFENYIQTDAAINPGNSGGALIDAHGRLVGINAAIYSRSGESRGIGFAIPVEIARGIMQQLLDKGEVSRGWLGIGGQNLTAALADAYGLDSGIEGVLISQVYRRGAADEAGLRPGDVIVSIDGTAVNSAFDIVNTVTSRAVGSEVHIQGWRGSAPLDIIARLRQRPARGGSSAE